MIVYKQTVKDVVTPKKKKSEINRSGTLALVTYNIKRSYEEFNNLTADNDFPKSKHLTVLTFFFFLRKQTYR